MAAATPPAWDNNDFSDAVGKPLNTLLDYLDNRDDIQHVETLDANENESPSCEGLAPGTIKIVIYFADNNGVETIEEIPYVTQCP
jgi:hypothetical protein